VGEAASAGGAPRATTLTTVPSSKVRTPRTPARLLASKEVFRNRSVLLPTHTLLMASLPEVRSSNEVVRRVSAARLQTPSKRLQPRPTARLRQGLQDRHRSESDGSDHSPQPHCAVLIDSGHEGRHLTLQQPPWRNDARTCLGWTATLPTACRVTSSCAACRVSGCAPWSSST